MRLSLFLFTIAFANLINACSIDSLAFEKLSLADSLLKIEKIDNAQLLIEEGLDLLKNTDDCCNWIHWQVKIGMTWQYKLKNSEKALEIYKKCLKNLWRSPKNEKEYKEKARLLTHIGYTSKRISGDLIAHRDYYQWACNIYEDTLKIVNFRIAKGLFHQLGNTYTNLKDYEKSEEYLKQVIEISRDFHAMGNVGRKQTGILGRMYMIKSDYRTSIDTFKSTLVNSDSISFHIRFSLLNNLATVHYHAKDYGNALNYVEKARIELEKAEISFEEREELTYNLHETYGKIYRGLEDYELSEYNYLKAFEILKNNPEEYSKRDLAFLRIYLGSLYVDWTKFNEALEQFNEKS